MSLTLGLLLGCQKTLIFIILASAAQAQLLGGAGTSSGFGSTSVLPPPSCVTKGQTLRRGACAAFVNYFVGNSQCGSSGQTFANAVRNAPQPSAECCSNALDFVSNSCSCNDAVLNSADLIDWDEDSIQCVARATLVSDVCDPGKNQYNPCGS
ncbi:hypothetical protein CVIRNUC_006669 [Coccomyxa viridis]|uniref:Extracellular protein n=1 Tax=Coccomyxa viridis TaxID=1274662 RepID=A0AAV1IBR4_9CHLO|nr:hypothetical protein CVIRNUC_006669 [Coccomyxa viridis]